MKKRTTCLGELPLLLTRNGRRVERMAAVTITEVGGVLDSFTFRLLPERKARKRSRERAPAA